MNETEFMALHANCINVREVYVAEARKTSAMLEDCTPGPLPFRQRFALVSQEIIERDAYLMYLQSKRLLHSAALLGYGALLKNSSPAATLALPKG